MFPVEKRDAVEYAPVADDESLEGIDEADGLIYRKPQPIKSRVKRIRGYLTRTATILLYSAFLVAITSAWWHKQNVHGPENHDCEYRTFTQWFERFRTLI